MKRLTYLIVGCGHFGRRAVHALAQGDPRSKIWVIDREEEPLRNVSHGAVETLLGDAVRRLDQLLSANLSVDYIIPAVPCHLAFEYFLWKLKPRGASRGDVPPLEGLPHVMRGKTGDVYASVADFLCPEDCQEPARCTVTGRRRGRPLYKVLAGLSGSFDVRVIRSHQLAPGVGGFRTSDLLGLLVDLEEGAASDRSGRPFLISTACRCHGVISALTP